VKTRKKLALLTFLLLVGIFVAGLFAFPRYKRREFQCDLAVMGSVKFADGIGRQSIGLIDCLKHAVSIKHLKFGSINLKNVSHPVQRIIKQKYKRSAHVLIYEEPLLHSAADTFPDLPETNIRIAYSMLECTKIPQKWVMILNVFFDAVAVPDVFLVDVYKNSGVRIPIFVVPLGMYLDPLLHKSFLHSKLNRHPFIFGNLGSICARKNQLTLLQAFAKAFGNDPNVKLLINGRGVEVEYLAQMNKTMRLLKLDNVTISKTPLNQRDYLRTLETLDCYVSPSIGEGFSLQPREAIALGLPSIVTDNTAQSTICLSGYVRAVPSPIPIKATYVGWKDDLGNQFGCTTEDLATALRDVYDNYELHARAAFEGRKWVEQYQHEHLQKLYKTLVLPKQVVLSDRNEIIGDVLYTTSPNLQKKYQKIQKKQTIFRKTLNSLIIRFFQN
jgi:glycosyltransferase involved in cell wall biosynthesis